MSVGHLNGSVDHVIDLDELPDESDEEPPSCVINNDLEIISNYLQPDKSKFNELNENLLTKLEDVTNHQLYKFYAEIMTKTKEHRMAAMLKQIRLNSQIQLAFMEVWKGMENTDKIFNELVYTLTFSLFKELTMRWPSWNEDSDYTDNSDTIKSSYVEFFFYIRCYLSKMIPLIQQLITVKYKKLKADREYSISLENEIKVECPLRHLKSMFYFEPSKHDNIPCVDEFSTLKIHPLFHKETNRYFLFWPYVTLNLKHPMLEMRHSTCLNNDYHIVNLNRSTVRIQQFKGIKNDLGFDPPEEFSKGWVINPLMIVLEDLCTSIADSTDIKTIKEEKINILRQLQNDLILCGNSITEKALYYNYLHRFPFIRYFGTPAENKPRITVEEQLAVGDNNGENNRLQQRAYAYSTFVLDKYTPMYNNTSQIKINSKDIIITYQCTLCDEHFGSNKSSIPLALHIMKKHGYEPDWICSFCNESFQADLLAYDKWKHTCKEDFLV